MVMVTNQTKETSVCPLHPSRHTSGGHSLLVRPVCAVDEEMHSATLALQHQGSSCQVNGGGKWQEMATFGARIAVN